LILYCIPTPLGGAPREALPAPAITLIRSLGDFVVENAKSARAFLGALDLPVRELSIKVIGEEPDPLAPLRAKRSLGLLSEAGCPAIADPGASLVEQAHREGFRVVPLVGPSSIVLALMASGLEGQRFAFCGYLPREATDRKKAIVELERRSRSEKGNRDLHRDALPQRRFARGPARVLPSANQALRRGRSHPAQ
jgi:16S rRNA (cytidine1402-2'-O)-methyltransferase